MSASIARDHLEVADPLAELAAVLRVGGRGLERALGDADRLGRDARPAAIERPHRDAEPVALGADAVRGGHAHAVERELGGRAAAEAHLVLDPGDREAAVPGPRR